VYNTETGSPQNTQTLTHCTKSIFQGEIAAILVITYLCIVYTGRCKSSSAIVHWRFGDSARELSGWSYLGHRYNTPAQATDVQRLRTTCLYSEYTSCWRYQMCRYWMGSH